jgi:hypothetical protein
MKTRATLSLGVFAFICMLLVACSSDEPMLQKDENEVGVNENYISLSEALQNADNEFALVYNSTRSDKRVVKTEVFQPQTRSEEQDLYGYYVVNYDKGFAMLSADRRRPAVIALSDEGSMQLSDTLKNDGLNWYRTEYLSESGVTTRPLVPDTAITVNPFIEKKTVISRCLLTGFLSKFSQDSPYNTYCFTESGESAVAGCVPIAVGTVMGYYKWPTSYNGYTFDWDAMYADSNNLLWARLFSLLGKSENLAATYGTTSTKVDPSRITIAMSNMGYKNATSATFSRVTLNSELRSGNPVLVGGYNDKSGHRWVIDGGYYTQQQALLTVGSTDYIYNYYYHCVWGWGGYANGYFLLDATTPSLGGTPTIPDEGTTGTTKVWSSLVMVYGYSPNN